MAAIIGPGGPFTAAKNGPPRTSYRRGGPFTAIIITINIIIINTTLIIIVIAGGDRLWQP